MFDEIYMARFGKTTVTFNTCNFEIWTNVYLPTLTIRPLYVYVHVCVHTVHVHACMCIYMYAYACMCMYMYNVHVCTDIYMYVCVQYTYMHACVCTCMHVHVCVCTCTMYMCIQIYKVPLFPKQASSYESLVICCVDIELILKETTRTCTCNM